MPSNLNVYKRTISPPLTPTYLFYYYLLAAYGISPSTINTISAILILVFLASAESYRSSYLCLHILLLLDSST